MLTCTYSAAYNTSASRRLLARLPPGTEEIVVIPETDCFTIVGDDAVTAAVHLGVYCTAGQRTRIPAWRGGRVALIADGTDGQAAGEVHGRTVGDPDVEDADAAILALAPDLWFDTIKLAPFVNNAGAMFLPGRYRHLASQTTAGSVPADATMNGRQALTFDLTDDTLAVTGPEALGYGAARLTIACVIQMDANPAAARVAFFFSTASSAAARAQIGVHTSGRMVLGGRCLDADPLANKFSANEAVPLGRPTVLIGEFDFVTATVTGWVDGVKVMDAVALTGSTPGAADATDSAAVYWIQTVVALKAGEALAWRNVEVDIQTLTTALKKKWKIA